MPSPLPPAVRTYLDTLTGDHPIHHLELAVSEDVICEFFTGDRSTKIKGRSALAQIIKQRLASLTELTISVDVDRLDGDCLHVTLKAVGTASPRHASSPGHGSAFVHDVAARYRIYAGRITEIAEHWTGRPLLGQVVTFDRDLHGILQNAPFVKIGPALGGGATVPWDTAVSTLATSANAGQDSPVRQ